MTSINAKGRSSVTRMRTNPSTAASLLHERRLSTAVLKMLCSSCISKSMSHSTFATRRVEMLPENPLGFLEWTGFSCSSSSLAAS